MRLADHQEMISDLRAQLRGRVIAPEDADYDAARTVFYGGIDRRPALIARVADAADVARVIALAQTSGLPLAVRGGGHGFAGHSVIDGGIVLDLRDMKALEIDPASRTAWAEAGLTAGEYTAAAAAHGLATGFGDTSSVGIGGITLGGGIGFLVRKYGLTIDSLLAAEIVTADGQLRRVDSDHHPDLFWAIRGGGGNFGVVTRFQFQLYPVDSIVGGMVILPATPDVITALVAAAAAAPEELSAIIGVMRAPPAPFLPAEHHGKLVVMSMIVYTGEIEAGMQAIAPFRALATPIVDRLGPMRYVELFPSGEEAYHPVATGRTMYIDSFDRSTADLILEHLQATSAQMAVAQLRVLGGASARVPVAATAYAHRERRIMANIAAMFQNPGEQAQHDAWAGAFARALAQGDTRGYVNFLGDEGPEQVRAAYPGETWERLRAIKARYDPTNFFRHNHNIPPAHS